MPEFHFKSRVEIPGENGIGKQFVDIDSLVIEASYEDAMRRNLVQEASNMAMGRYPQGLRCATLSDAPAIKGVEDFLAASYGVDPEDIWRTNYNPLDHTFSSRYQKIDVAGRIVFVRHHGKYGFIEYAAE